MKLWKCRWATKKKHKNAVLNIDEKMDVYHNNKIQKSQNKEKQDK